MNKDKQIEEYKTELTRLNQLLKDAADFFNTMPYAVVMVLYDNTVRQCNHEFCKMFSCDTSDIMNAEVISLFRDEQNWQEIISECQDKKARYEFVRKDGSFFTGEAHLHILFNKKEKIRGYSLTIRDVTEQSKYEKELEFQSMLLDKIEDTITATDLEGNITYVNEAESRAFGKTRAELIGTNVGEYGEDTAFGASQQEIINKTLADGKWSGRVVNYTTSGRKIYYNTQTQLLYDKAGNPEGMVGVSSDVTSMQEALAEIQEREVLSKTLFRQSAIGIAQLNREGDHIQVNKTYCALLGYSKEEFEHLNFMDITYKDDLLMEQDRINKIRSEKLKSVEYVKRIEHKDGRYIWVQVYGNIVRDKTGTSKYTIVSLINISQQRADSERLLSLATRLTLAAESAEIGIWEWDLKTKVVYWDERMHQLYGVDKSEFGHNYETWKKVVHPDDLERANLEVNLAIAGDKDFDTVFRVVWKDKSVHFIRAFAVIQRDAGKPVSMIGINYDVTKAKLDEKKIKFALSEKNTLLRELYHRTKNNMQVISSMLDLEALSNENEIVRSTFQEMGNRIQTMSMVHHKLYQSHNLSKIDLGDYIKELSELLVNSNCLRDKSVSLELELESIEVLIDTAIPCGLILNELISNSLKYAFKKGKKGKIGIKLFMEESNIHFIYQDNGAGVSTDFDLERDSNLGLLLVRKLSGDQLRGLSRFDYEAGFGFEMKFCDDYYKERV